MTSWLSNKDHCQNELALLLPMNFIICVQHAQRKTSLETHIKITRQHILNLNMTSYVALINTVTIFSSVDMENTQWRFKK